MTPRRVVRSRRLWLLAALAAVSFVLSLVGLERRDDGWLLQLGGRFVDLRGALWAAWQDSTRNCAAVQRLDPEAAQRLIGPAAAAVEALRGFSPPDSASARVWRVDHWPLGAGEPVQPALASSAPAWFVLQADFDGLEPVVVLVRQEKAYTQVVAQGVWSGTTMPWNPAWRIRSFLGDRVPQAPPALLACVDPVMVFAQPPKPL